MITKFKQPYTQAVYRQAYTTGYVPPNRHYTFERKWNSRRDQIRHVFTRQTAFLKMTKKGI